MLRDPQTVTVNVFNPAGELVRQFTAQSLSPSSTAGLTLKSAAFSPSAGGPGLAIQYGSAGDTVTWDGRDAGGALVSPGSYLVTVSSTQGGVAQRWEKAVTVLGHGGGDPLDGPWPGPTPAAPPTPSCASPCPRPRRAWR